MPRPAAWVTAILVTAAIWSADAARVRDPDGRGPTPQASERGAERDSVDLAEIQRLLNSLDFHAGAAVGIPGPRTRAAIKEFQLSDGRAADGAATHRLLARLRERASAPRREGAAAAPAQGSAHVGSAIIGSLPGSDTTRKNPRLKRLIDTDFFGLRAIPKPWRTAGDGFTPHRRLGMRAGAGRGAVLRTLHDAWADLSAALGFSDAAAETAYLYGPRPFGGPFELTVGFRIGERPGRLTFGPYQGAFPGKNGYRCVVSPADGHRISLIRIENGRETAIAERSLRQRMNPGILHELTWRRTASGGMEIALGETSLFSICGGHADATFGGVVIAARNGGYSISHVRLRAAAAGGALSASR